MGIESLLAGSYAQRICRRFGRTLAFVLGMLVLSLPVQAQSSSAESSATYATKAMPLSSAPMS